MVSSLAWQLNSRKRITGFGARCFPIHHIGKGVIRRAVGAIARPALGFIANKVADLISGTGKKRIYRKRTVRGSSYKITGMGSRRPRSRLSTVHRRRNAIGGMTHRKPRSTLVIRRRR